MNGEFKEFGGLADRLKRSDFSGESRVRNTLRERLLDRAEARRRRVPAFAWLLPAAAAAVLLLWPRGQEVPVTLAAAPGYELADDGYSQCGRRGLGDVYGAARF